MDDEFLKKLIYRRILDWTVGKQGKPVKMLLQTTYKCNLNCLFCENLQARKKGKFDYSKELTLEEWYKIIIDSAKDTEHIIKQSDNTITTTFLIFILLPLSSNFLINVFNK